MVTVRAAEPADVAVLAAVARAAYRGYVPLIGREPAPMTADYAAAVAAGGVWVAELAEREDGGRVVGLLVLRAHPDHLLLENIAVAPDAQGSGVGTALLAVADREAAAAGLPEIRLYTNEAMTGNLAWYPRHGYTRTHRATEHGYHRVWFRRAVPT